MKTDAQTGEEAEVHVTSSAPVDINMYLLDDPEQGLVKISKEQCYGSMDQAEQTSLPLKVQTQQLAQASNTTARIQLNVAGIGGVEESFLPTDVVIAIDSSGSMRDNDPSNLRLNAAQEFVNKLTQTREVRSAIVSWDDDIDFATPLTSNSLMTKMKISNIDRMGETNLDRGLIASISILDNATRDEPSSKAILFFSDGEEGYTLSGNIGSPADDARRKGYKIFSFGLNIERGTNEEKNLNDMAIASDGRYYSLTAENLTENLQAAYDNIIEPIVTSTEPANINVTGVTRNYITINQSSFSIKPESILRNLTNDETIIRWENIEQYVGNKNNKLSAGEIFNVYFSASVLPNMEGELNATLPIWNKEESMVEYTDPSGNVQPVSIPQTYINLASQICPEPPNEQPHLVLHKFIVPRSFNGTIGVYEDRGSNVFKPDEEIQLYVEYGGIKQNRTADNSGNIKYSTYTTGNFTITDKEGNIVYATNENSALFDIETLDSRDSNGSGAYVFKYYPLTGSRDPGDYVINYTIHDNNLSPRKRIQGDARFILEGEKGEFQVVNGKGTFIEPGSANCTAGVYRPHESKVFNADEVFNADGNIEYYIDLAGMTQSRTADNNNNSRYLTSVYANLTITDKEGNAKASPILSEVCPAANKYTDTWVSNNTYVFGLNSVSPPFKTGEYVMKFTIVDNLSGENESVPENVTIKNIGGDALRALENATVAQTNATKTLQDKLLKLIEEQKI